VSATIFAFPILPGSAKAQVIWGGVVAFALISYFIGSITAKKMSKSVRASFITSQRLDVF